MNRDYLQPMKILLVEDNLHDIEITRRAFSQGKITHEIFVVRDGQDALNFLFNRGTFQDREIYPRPNLVLLDLNLPKVTGLEVLSQIKQDDNLKTIPVIIHTVSQREEDIKKSYQLGANSYIHKKMQFEHFIQSINILREYWISTAVLPPP